ncbi:MAG: P-loop NTPase [Proteobacteria bacterium]|nr:P-loop NTPase [Pseudomonadota bacterium]MBU1233748.1 P-loop NTPase [Pseudomonadota bacterium]MBU1419253.1 P-loop NTPase [Pseudomonadota bacterium]MBU1453881.1 P-loop NTPase [Pseudomonadota bacterium]
MAVTISIGSGKGGTGKTMILCNLALLLAKKGLKVCLVDLDIGGADAHLLFGLFEPKFSLTDFLTRRVESMDDALHTFYSFNGLQLLPGTGSTLQTANMTYQEKQRLLKGLSSLDADVVLIDVGAGTSYHSLDFFMYADVQICVTMPEPTSIMDFYNFLQLATIRKVLGSFLSNSQVSLLLKKQNFSSLSDVFALAENTEEGAREKAQQALHGFNPLLIINRNTENGKVNKAKLKKLVAKYLGIDIPSLGEIPEDLAINEALRAYMPVCELLPDAPSAVALMNIADKVEKIIELFQHYSNQPDIIERD